MKELLLLYLVLALFSERLRRAPAVFVHRLGHAFRRWCVLRQPWRIAWQRACREIRS
ncbi:MAG: hypothetical protein J5X22_20930 [Candidatus Accumulibacter sp.]|uniref:hypothetical protein n=1 Tax=Accumulibacter sp. TaxID=2053492 RepID=UPI001AC998AE|nr:hypothetical protein [Accumulibacter sp.]MBN8516617.1 hypothetical protein [Accumulibacter sp.]MBO3712859.1 hypothetical protein [Accumulibacter sp.]